MRYSICVDAVFKGMDFLEALKRCCELGIKNIEFWSWWDKDIEAVAEFIYRNEMTVTTFCSKFISLTDPLCRTEFQTGLKEGIAVARRLGCRQMIVQTGMDTGESRQNQRKSLVEGLKSCQYLLEENEMSLLLEPLNVKIDHPGYLITTSDEMAEILEELEASCFKMLFDIYHQQISEGDLLAHIKTHFSKIAHIHAAGHPGRHELYYSEINYPYLFEKIEDMGYRGYIGLEYFPLDIPEKGVKILTSK